MITTVLVTSKLIIDNIERYQRIHVMATTRHIITLTNNAVSFLLAFVLNHHKPMGLYLGGPLCMSVWEMKTIPVNLKADSMIKIY